MSETVLLLLFLQHTFCCLRGAADTTWPFPEPARVPCATALAAVGQLEILCLLAAIVAIAALVCFTDIIKTPEKLTKEQRQKLAYQKVVEKVSHASLRALLDRRPRPHLKGRRLDPAK